eukprot:SAG11_NODE_1133_length_5735_cov_8.895671_2_plen_125_part_00
MNSLRHDCTFVVASVENEVGLQLDVSLGSDPYCLWPDPRTFRMQLGPYTDSIPMLSPGHYVRIFEGVVLNEAENSNSSAGRILVEAPVEPGIPFLVLKAAKRFGLCDPILIGTSGSFNTGGATT